MSIQYSGGTIVNTTFTSDGTRAQMQSQLVSALGTAGWSTVSGGGTSDTLMQTATTPQGASCQARIYDPAANNCIQVYFRNAAGSKISQAAYVLPSNGATYRIIANKYQFFMFMSGTGNVSTARTCVMGGVLYLPSFIVSALGADLEHFWMGLNGGTDSTTTLWNTMRNTLTSLYSLASGGSSLWSSTLINYTNGYYVPAVRVLTSRSAGSNLVAASLWADGSYAIGDATMDWGTASAGSVNTRGVVWDSFVLHGASLNTEQTLAGPDGHTFMVLTHATTSQLCVRVS